MKSELSILLALFVSLCAVNGVQAQSLNSGTIEGAVTDPSGALVPGAKVHLSNPITGHERSAVTDASGAFRFLNVPLNTYSISVAASGFQTASREVDVRSSAPLTLRIPLVLAGGQTSVTVKGAGVLENVPASHSDVDRKVYSLLPTMTPGSSLSDAITLSSPGVVADSNGFFHPLGDHAQTSYALDGQPIADQQSKMFSTQIPENAIQSMELITGAPAAEYGDKTSLVVNATTRSGLGQKPFGSFTVQYGSFGTIGEQASFGFGGARVGNFLAVNSQRSGRFLDAPELYPVHDIGNSETIFDRFDWQASGRDIFHLNLLAARNWFQTPITYDQSLQDQRQRVLTYNIAPGYQRTLDGGRLLLSINPFIRRDQVDYYPSPDPFDDSPVTISAARTLTNYGLKAAIDYVHSVHSIKAGIQVMQTRLKEDVSLGITDPAFNPVCLDSSGAPVTGAGITGSAYCATAGYQANPDLQPGLLPYDLTRGGSLFQFAGRANVNQYAVFLEDNLTFGGFTLTPGLRFDQYNGLAAAHAVQPRIGVSYLLKPTATVLRASYTRAFETPYNENLILSSSTGSGGLAANVFGAYANRPVLPGGRNQYNAGLQQALGRALQIDAEYFWKFTENAYDFNALLNTPLVFPISWHKSKIDGVALRVSTSNLRGFQAYATMGHTRARYFGPENGGVMFNSPLDTGVFRIDHDQAFQQTVNLTYRRPQNGPWAAFTWRYDSGLVAGAVESLADALSLTADQQAAIGFYCGSQSATRSAPITSCASTDFGATRLTIPAPGMADPDHNPPRIAPRHILDLGFGTDDLFHTEPVRATLKITIANLTNEAALYNFLSTFSGTHFVAPRSYRAEMGLVF